MRGGLVDISACWSSSSSRLSQPDVEVDGLAVEALGRLFGFLAGLLLLGGDRGVEEEPVTFAFKAFATSSRALPARLRGAAVPRRGSPAAGWR